MAWLYLDGEEAQSPDEMALTIFVVNIRYPSEVDILDLQSLSKILNKND